MTMFRFTWIFCVNLNVMTAFFDEKSKEANWPSGGVHFDLRT